jgi:mono/diheme cytochrome c family protein
LLLLPVVGLLAARITHSTRQWRYGATPTKPPTPRPVVPSDRKLAQGWIGIDTDPREPAGGGVRIAEVYVGAPAESSGIRVGDVLLAANGAPVTPESLLAVIAATRIGEEIHLRRRRASGAEDDVSVPVALRAGVDALVAITLASGARGLATLQLADDLWPHFHESSLDGQTRSGVATSALACAALATAGDEGGDVGRSALERGVAALLARRGPDGGLIDPGLSVPHRVYANAFLAIALAAFDRQRFATELRELDEWLCRAQVDERTVAEFDWTFGAWNYFEDPLSLRTDVSVASWALEAMAAGGVARDRVEWARAGFFLDRCQNFETASNDPVERAAEAPLRDGGFAFTPRYSKAGSRDVGETLMVGGSYGSATADGVRGLLAAGARREERTLAALRWIARSYTVQRCPGFADADPWASGIHYYWLASLARALHAAKVDEVRSGGVEHAWPDEIVRFLANRQNRLAGTWQNANGMMYEDRPTIATSMAVLALAAARDRLQAHDGCLLDGGAAPAPPPPERAPWRPAARSILERGRRTFLDKSTANCASCHEDSGAGNGPSLVGIADRYLDEKRTHDAAAEYLQHHIRDPETFPGLTRRVWEARMPAYGPSLIPDAALADLVEFLLSRTERKPVSGSPSLDSR